VIFDKILHDYTVESDISPGQQLLVQQLLAHELHKQVLVLVLYFGQNRFVCCLLYAHQFVNVLPQGREVVLYPLLLLLALLCSN